MSASKKRGVRRKITQVLHDPFANLSSKKLIPLPGFKKRLEEKSRIIKPNLRSEEEDDFFHRDVTRPDESRVWMRQRLG